MSDLKMTTKEAIEILESHNRWRRGIDERPLEETGLTPEQIGVAIDKAVAVMKQHQAGVVYAGVVNG